MNETRVTTATVGGEVVFHPHEDAEALDYGVERGHVLIHERKKK
jgi:hypothetical protein